MPDLQFLPDPPQQAPMAEPNAFAEADFALGCECADPALQIERWAQEYAGTAEPH